MPDYEDIEAALVGVVASLDTVGATWRIGGSVASSTHGEWRMTGDVDLVCDLRLAQVDAFVGFLGGDYFSDPGAVRDAVRRRSCFNVIHLDTVTKVDLFVLGHHAYDRAAFRRAVELPLGSERRYWIGTAEDTVLAKLRWFRQGGESSEQQWRDVLGVLVSQWGSLEEDYLHEWAPQIGVDRKSVV